MADVQIKFRKIVFFANKIENIFFKRKSPDLGLLDV